METGNIKLDLDTEVRTLNFEELNLSQKALDELTKADLQEATPLQQSIISNIINKQNLVIKADGYE
jgi:superfamily II DNA/RNA helicase